MRHLLFTAALVCAAPLFATDAPPVYVGAAVCAKCHADEHKVWTSSRHSKMVQPATPNGVQGDFHVAEFRLHGQPYKVREEGGKYFITESNLTGQETEHRIDYTLGNRRIQHYLTTLPDGRIITLAPSWDIQRKEWFHNLDIVNPNVSTTAATQVWNKQCFSCHVSDQKKNYDAKRDTYDTKWIDFGIDCERCHGPGGEHVAVNNAKQKPANPAAGIVLQTKLDGRRNSMVCAQCHSYRNIFQTGFTAGSNYFDYFLPVLEYGQFQDKDPAYWADGRPRRFSSDALGFWQSECYLKGGATCLTCHTEAHDTTIEKAGQLRPSSTELCTSCHQEIAKSVEAHTHHAPSSAGSQCVDCHMPRTVYSIKAEIRDHTISIPVPENTINHEIPNACNLCHKDRDAQWASDLMNVWYGGAGKRQKLIRQADVFAMARNGKREAIPELITILNSATEHGPLARANAVGHLSHFLDDARAQAALEAALNDSEDAVRAAAAARLMLPSNTDTAARQKAVNALVPKLSDAVATVRLGAAVSLVNMGVQRLNGDDGDRFEKAKKLLSSRTELNADDPSEQLLAGNFYLMAGDFPQAAHTLEAALKLDPRAPARLQLAFAYTQTGKVETARALLKAIPQKDVQYQGAQKMLAAMGQRQ